MTIIHSGFFCYEKMLTMVVLDNFDVGCIWFSDQAHFDLFGNVDKQNFHYYSDSQPCQTISKPLHSPHVMIWCAISVTGIIDYFFWGRWFKYHGQLAALFWYVEDFFHSGALPKMYTYSISLFSTGWRHISHHQWRKWIFKGAFSRSNHL